jgi:phosphoglycolate phosphatase-like HAD superfamily hydrolase
MAGKVDYCDVSRFMAPHLGLGYEEIQYWMREGCKNLELNQSVFDLLKRSRLEKKKTALVTGNIDLFTSVVAPDLSLESLFDVVVNSFDHREPDKTILWRQAFEKIGIDSKYRHSLLIEDSKSNIDAFHNSGGFAYHYEGEFGMKLWIAENIGE